MDRSDAAFDRGELGLSIDAAREAMGWYLPYGPHVGRARERLIAIAVGAEASGRTRTALRAWGALRGALNETRHPWSVDDAPLAQANAGIVRLLPRADNAADEDSADVPSLAEGYATEVAPQPTFRAATSLALLLMVLSGWTLLTRREVGHAVWAVAAGAAGLFLWVFAALGA